MAVEILLVVVSGHVEEEIFHAVEGYAHEVVEFVHEVVAFDHVVVVAAVSGHVVWVEVNEHAGRENAHGVDLIV